MNDSLALPLGDLAATQHFAKALARFMDPGRVFCLSGPLGAGKSELAREMITARCGPQDDIPSPTFTLVQPYQAPDGCAVWHMDLYRLETAEQALALGIEEAFFDCCCLIEWPDRIQDLLPGEFITVDLAMGLQDDSRVAALAAPPDVIDRFKQDFFA